MLTVIPSSANDWLKSSNPATSLGQFPPNLIGGAPQVAAPLLTDDIQQKIMRFMYDKYIWPQIMERRQFEPMWQKLLDMYRIKMDKVDSSIDEQSPAGLAQKEDSSQSGPNVRLADSVMYDAVERLTDVTHFISWKEGSPIQYNIPGYYDTRGETMFYHPMKDLIKAGNSLLQWNIDNEEVWRKHLIQARHFYTYGCAFAKSEFAFVTSIVQRMMNTGRQVQVPEITKIGTTFEPLSIWKLWLNWRLNAYEMDYQPCPFFFEETPRFATLQNAYHPQMRPFGFGNLDRVIAKGEGSQWLYTDEAMSGLRKAMQAMAHMDNNPGGAIPNILQDKYSVEALWTFYPMLPLDPQTMEWQTRQDGSPVPFQRFLMQTWGENLVGKQIILRLQRNFYPRDQLPIYGTSHMPDLESGLYAPSLGYLLWNHYREVVTIKNQYIVNKDRINNPPHWVLATSPAAKQDLTSAGVRVEVNGPHDYGYMDVVDATQSTVTMMQHLREQAKTSTKSEDAILGKALGGRTSATEAQNAFQAAMSAITTPINLFNYDIMGGFATRVWEYTATWFPPELLKAITGQMGYILTPEQLWTRVGLKWDVGSTYVESIVRQQNIQYILQSSMGDPSMNRAPMWKALLTEWRFDNADEWVNDGGFQREVFEATNQAAETFLGNDNVVIDPDQNHQIAIEVKKAFIEDKTGPWMTKYPERAQLIVQQIQMHMQLLMLQMQMQQAQQKANAPLGESGPPPSGGGGPTPTGQPPMQSNNPAQSAGQAAQQAGGMV